MSCLCIIPARGGSKRIPKKNIRCFNGRPIISYPIMNAIDAKIFTHVMVSTDDDQIGNIAKDFGASVPFKRSCNTANDTASTAEVVLEVLNEYKKIGMEFDYVCCLYPVAVFTDSNMLKNSFELLQQQGISGVVPVVRFGFPIQRAVRIVDGKMQMIWPENAFARSQDLEPAYHDCGQFYWARVINFLSEKTLYLQDSLAYEIDEMHAQDIDTFKDWEIAEFKYSLLAKNNFKIS